ncbi:MAG: DsbA family protein [Anaerolineae bacterium]|nr:DsbA family protein [Anaerolineae bacterium]
MRWRSYELRPAGAPPMPPEYKAKILAGRPRFEAMARERYGVSINPGPFGFNSRPALIGEKYAESQGLLHAYHDAVMAAYWQNAVDIGRIENLADIAESVGINRNDFLNALSAETYAKAVDQDILFARQNGLNGVPALVFENRYLVSGAQSAAALRQVVDEILANPSV